MIDIEHQVSNYDSESVDSDGNSYSACIECNCMTWRQEERVCDKCNYILLEPKPSFHEDKLKLSWETLTQEEYMVYRQGELLC